MEHESFQGRQPVPGLPTTRTPKKNTIRANGSILAKSRDYFPDHDLGVHLRPHDLRRHAATYASRSELPVEIVSKVILRHANLSTTQRYLGKVSDVEAVRRIENLYG
jgi:integrase